MLTIGIDIGSTTTKGVLLKDGVELIRAFVYPAGTGSDGPDRVIKNILGTTKIEGVDALVVTGYGRMLYKNANKHMSEMSCHAKGVSFLLPEVDTIIDIGGQDVKVLRLGANRNLEDFVMNDKCAAGTGRFLDVMARVLQVETNQLAGLAEKSENLVTISNICTVFAESEVISHLSTGAEKADICAGIHSSVAKRAAGLVKRLPTGKVYAMTGGVAQNLGVVKGIEQELKAELLIPESPQIMGALGAAIYAAELC